MIDTEKLRRFGAAEAYWCPMDKDWNVAIGRRWLCTFGASEEAEREALAMAVLINAAREAADEIERLREEACKRGAEPACHCCLESGCAEED